MYLMTQLYVLVRLCPLSAWIVLFIVRRAPTYEELTCSRTSLSGVSHPPPFRGSLASSFLEALVSGARPMEIVASPKERLERVRVLPLSVVES